jgi:DNA polymerase sigma
MFLEFYGQTFDYNECALAFYDNKPLITKKSQLNDFCPSLLTIVDPVNPGENQF